MEIRIWSKKIVAVLRYLEQNPHTVLFGVTGDIDNLGVYVARNGRAKAEVLVDSYNRVVGSIYYEFISERPHKFYESHFLPAGEELLIFGICATRDDAQSLFAHLSQVDVPNILAANSTLEVGTTAISFGCDLLNKYVDLDLLNKLLKKIEGQDTLSANDLYTKIIERIRNVLALQLDLKKFWNISTEENVAVVLRKLVYAKTLQYKSDTKKLLLEIGERVRQNQGFYDQLCQILGENSGLDNRQHQEILMEISRIPD